MADTTLTSVADQIQKFWSPLFMKELRESLLLGALVNKDYDGEIKQLGDQVRVSQIVAPNGELKTVGVDADTFTPEAMVTMKVDIKADKRAIASYQVDDLVEIQSQIGAQQSAIRDGLMFAIQKQVNDYLYSLVAPSLAAPDHRLGGTAAMSATVLASVRKLAAQAKWMKEKGWYGLIDPTYYADLLNAQTLTSSDFGASDAPVIGGQIGNQRFGFNLLEDNGDGLAAHGLASEKAALFFHPDFMHMVTQVEPRFKISDLHSQNKFKYCISVDLVFGAKLGIAGNVKHILVTAAA